MTQKQRLSFLVIIFVGAAFYFWKASQQEESVSVDRLAPVAETITLTEEAADPVAAPSEAQETPIAEQTVVQRQISEFPKNLAASYREEIKQEAHRTPAAAIKAAAQLYAIAQSVQNEQDAEAALEFFSQCTTAKDSVLAIQTACYRHARKISQTYPKYAEKFATLDQQTGEDVLRIVHMDHH